MLFSASTVDFIEDLNNWLAVHGSMTLTAA